MAEYQPEVVSSMLMWNGLDKHRDDVAERVNAEHGTNVTKRDVSDVINAIESEADAGNARQVYLRYHLRGFGADMGEQMAQMLAQSASSSN